ncbi:DCP2-domain-containing protein [Aureobasidium sp. EXF-10728]|nr:DCP2-domain-containing protein [Aureobasidium sp. EXF-10728]
MQLVDWLDDLCVRFIINLPQEELESVARICFQVEEAQWFYEDFIRPTDPSLPSLNLRDFCLRIFQHCPLLSTFSDSQHTAAYQEFLAYKTRVPVRGAILLNHDMDQVVLVKGWKKSATWSFPRGKINKDEPDLDCAVREVWEETGYDIAAAGLANDDQKYIDVTMREQHLRMFVFRGVPLDTHFEPKTRKEISKIAWYRLTDLPSYTNKKQNNRVISHQQDGNADNGTVSANKLYMVAPFLPPLKKWINQQKKRDAARQAHVEPVVEEAVNVSSDSPAVEVPAANAASELKRLLSVNVSGQESPQTASGEGNQANALLAMLRGNASTGGLAPPASNDLPPATPLDQVVSTPPEPGTPHYHHHQPSPAVRQQPPPGFPFPSPAHQRNVSLHPPGFFGQNAHENLQRVMPEMSHMSQQPPHAVGHIHPRGPHPSMQQQLFPGGHPAPIAHGPIAPSASQLPAPRLNNHAMNLLSAFKAPSQSPVTHNAMPFPSPHQNHMQTQQQQPFGEAQHARRRSAHQNSLLGLFKSPDPPRATPVSQAPQTTLPFHTAQSPAPSAPTPTAPNTQQRNANLAMLTRTLPKAKPTPSPAQTNMDMFPAKQVVQEVQAIQNKATPEASSKSFAPDAPRAPMSILPRPGSAATTAAARGSSGSPAPPPSESVQTPHKLRRGNKSDSPANFTILQRPSPRADHSGSPEMGQARQPPPPKQATPKQAAPKQSAPRQAQEAPKQFQPQILQRPKVDKPAASPGVEQAPQHAGEQRNALLALFAKQNAGLSQAESRSGSAMSNKSGGPVPTDASMFRSRLASASSVVSNGGDNDGLRSPSTPVEAKGFLLDYLNGVVKSEKNRGPKRGGPV